MPFFSICIPTYNMAHWVVEAIDSVLRQTDGDFELLVGDNASTDDTRTALEKYTDPRIRVYRHETNLGAYGNVNFLLRNARGKWVHVLCADDTMSPVCLEAVRLHVGKAKVIAVNSVKSADAVVKDVAAVTAVYCAPREFLLALNTRSIPLGLIQLFADRDAMAENGYYREISMAEDYGTDSYAGWELFLKHGCIHIPTPLTYERYHATQGRFSQGAYKGMRDYFRFFADYDSHLRVLPGYPREVRVFQDRIVAQQLMGGLRRLVLNLNGSYLRETLRVLSRQGYRRLPAAAICYCVKERFWPSRH
jgi:glycosyltransferase involved in cell wall biosynthesis